MRIANSVINTACHGSKAAARVFATGMATNLPDVLDPKTKQLIQVVSPRQLVPSLGVAFMRVNAF